MNQHELHPAGSLAAAPLEPEGLAWHEAQPVPPLPPLSVNEAEGTVWVTVDPRTGRLERAADAGTAAAGFRTVRRRLKNDLAMLALRPGILVNGLPALPLTVLTVKDSIVLAPGCLAYVTERVRPFSGTPPAELLGRPCPLCRMPVDAKTRIVICQCGAPYHHETEASHPDLPEDDRLRCFERVKICLSCNRPVTADEYLAWGPSDL